MPKGYPYFRIREVGNNADTLPGTVGDKDDTEFQGFVDPLGLSPRNNRSFGRACPTLGIPSQDTYSSSDTLGIVIFGPLGVGRRSMRRISFPFFFTLILLFFGFSFFFPPNSMAQDSPSDKKTMGNAPFDNPFQGLDALGRSVRLSRRAQRIISLSPAVTETLFAIGAGASLVGRTDFCDYPPEVAQKPSVGGFSGNTISVERIVSLKPDLVILSAEMHGKIIDILDRLSIPSFAMEPHTFAQVYQDIQTLGKLSGHRTEAEKVVETMQEKIALVQRRVSSMPRIRVFWELWDDPLMTTGSFTFISEAVFLAGGKNIFDDLPERWPTVSLEQIIIRKPEWILSATDHGDRVNLQAITKRSGWSSIPAIQQGHVGLIDSDSISRGGPRLADAVQAIAQLIHPEP